MSNTIDIHLQLLGPTAPAGAVAKVLDKIVHEATKIALDQIRAVWLVESGDSLAGFTIRRGKVLGTWVVHNPVPYSYFVQRRKGAGPMARVELPQLYRQAITDSIEAHKGQLEAAFIGEALSPLRST